MTILKQTANDVIKIFMQGMEQKSNGWIFCNDYPGTTSLTENAYQKQLTVKQVKWLLDISAKYDLQTLASSRGGRSLSGWIHETLHWDLFVRKNNSGVLTIKRY